jgi:hypothetical protein
VGSRGRVDFEIGRILVWGCALSRLRFAQLKSEIRNRRLDCLRPVPKLSASPI